jgi:hypothetical protein
MESQSEVQSSHNSSFLAVSSRDDLTEGQQLCLSLAGKQDWDRIKGYAKEHGPEVLLGVYSEIRGSVVSLLTIASHHDNVEMVKLILEAGFDNKAAMYIAAQVSMRSSDNSTTLRLLLEHGLDPNFDVQFEGAKHFSNLLMHAARRGHIDNAMALLDHGANVNKTVVGVGGDVISPLAFAINCGAHDICRLYLTRGAIPSTNDVGIVLSHCLQACKGEHPYLTV